MLCRYKENYRNVMKVLEWYVLLVYSELEGGWLCLGIVCFFDCDGSFLVFFFWGLFVCVI